MLVMNLEQMMSNDKLLKIAEVEKLIGFKKDFIYTRIKQGAFPKPIKFGKASRCRYSDIQNWIAQQ